MTAHGAERAARAWLNRHAREVRGLTRLAWLAGMLVGLAIIVQAGLFAWVVQAVLFHEAGLDALRPALAGMMAAILLRSAAQWGQEVAGLEAGIRVRRAARHELLDHIARLGPVRLADRHSAALAGQLLEQVEALHGYYARFLPQLGLALAVPLLILLVVAFQDWLAALFLLAAAPLIPLFMALVGMGAERLNREQFIVLSRLSGQFLDRVRGLATLQLFGHAGHSVAEVVAASDEYRRRSMRTLRVAFLSTAVLEFFASVAIAVIAIYIGFGLLGFVDFGPAPGLTLYSGLFVLLLAPEFFQPLRTLAQHYHDRAAALGAAGELLELLSRPVAARPMVVAPAALSAPAVRIEGVEVGHPGRGRILGPLDLSLMPGECVTLCGPSGSGKSTLLQLIAGFLTPDRGRVLVFGNPPGGPVAWMDQRPLLIGGSLADNLRLIAPRAGTRELTEALRKAGLEAFVDRLPRGLDTPLGERGEGVSGGQARRLALARVFLSDASLVLLDEPTENLDEASEHAVLRSLSRLVASGRTLLIATHHRRVMGLVDRIIRLEAGRIVTHD